MEDKLKRLEIISKRFERKTKNVSKKAMITPIPVSSIVFGDEVKGDILKYMFSCQGKITKAAIDLGKKPKFYVSTTFSISNEANGNSKVVTIDRKRIVVDLDIEVKEFDKLTVFISYKSEKPEDNLTEASVSFLWIPTIKDIEVRSFLISDLEKEDASS